MLRNALGSRLGVLKLGLILKASLYRIAQYGLGEKDDVLSQKRRHLVNPLGIKGLGAIGIVGVAAAIANAIYHATGKRVRDLPITLDKLCR